MAYTSVIPVRRLDRTVDYVQNKEKTTPKSLEEAVDYAANRDKTDSACFETGLGCTTTSAFEDMRLNTLRWHKETGVQGYHLVQSFVEGEVTPELAHQIGVEQRGKPLNHGGARTAGQLLQLGSGNGPVPGDQREQVSAFHGQMATTRIGDNVPRTHHGVSLFQQSWRLVPIRKPPERPQASVGCIIPDRL